MTARDISMSHVLNDAKMECKDKRFAVKTNQVIYLFLSWILHYSPVTVNSSTEIKCLILHSDPMGVYLHRGFHGNKDVMYLQMENGQVTKKTTSVDFTGRIQVSHNPWEGGHAMTWQLSQLRLEDTDWYYCEWLYPCSKTLVTNTSIGTIVVVRGRECRANIQTWNYILCKSNSLFLHRG